MEDFFYEDDYDLDDDYDLSDDPFLHMIAEAVNKQESGVHVLNPSGIDMMKQSLDLLKNSISGDDIQITYELHEPWPSMGGVTVTGKSINIDDTFKFCKAAKLASNFEVVPRFGNVVWIGFAFNGLTKKIGDE